MVHPSNDHPDLHEGIPTREQLDAMSTAELLEALEQTLFSMTEENYDGELLDAYLDELDRKSPMPEHPATQEVTVEYIETLLPTVPDGFVMGEPVVFRDYSNGDIEYILNYVFDDKFITFSALYQSGEDVSLYEKDNQNLETYKIDEITFYVFMNNKYPTAAWKVNNIECGLSTNLTLKELTHILFSSYQREANE